MKLFKQNDKLNVEEVNEVVSLTKKILHLFYIAMVVAMILIVTIIVREWGILQFLLSVLSVLAPFFIGFVLALSLIHILVWIHVMTCFKKEKLVWKRRKIIY